MEARNQCAHRADLVHAAKRPHPMASAMIPAAATTIHSDWRPPAGPKTVYLAMPCDDGHKLDFWRSLLALQSDCLRGATQHTFRLRPCPGDSLIPRARNNLTWDWYMNTADDYIGFIDSDLDFRSIDIFQLIDANLPIIAGKYAIKQPELRWCINSIPGHELDQATQQQNVAAAGTGIIFIHRYVIGTLIAEARKWSQWAIPYIADEDGNERYNLFYNGVVHDPEWFTPATRYLSEDWGFCYLARRHGFRIVLDHRSIALHEGSIKYPLQMRRMTAEEEITGQIKQIS